MKDLTLVEKFDAVLKSLYEMSGKRPSFKRIEKLLRIRGKKLIRKETIPLGRYPNEVLYLLTFEGKLMHERGGLKWKLFRDKFTITWAIASSALTLITASVVAYYATKSVTNDSLAKYYELFQQNNKQIEQFQKSQIKTIKTLQDTVEGIYKTLSKVKIKR